MMTRAKRECVAALDSTGTECVLATFDQGEPYPRVQWDGVRMSAARWVCAQVHGPCPEGHEVCHSCGVSRCIHPAHLRWGTALENSADKREHGTMHNVPRGEDVSTSVLTEAKVRTIRRLAAEGVPYRRIARRVGCSVNAAASAGRGATWAHVTNPPPVRVGGQ